MKTLIVLTATALLVGCSANRSFLPSMPKDVKFEEITVTKTNPMGVTTTVTAKGYESQNYQNPLDPIYSSESLSDSAEGAFENMLLAQAKLAYIRDLSASLDGPLLIAASELVNATKTKEDFEGTKVYIEKMILEYVREVE